MGKRRSNARSSGPVNAEANSSAPLGWSAVVVLSCFLARWFIPTEGAVQGTGLWLAVASFFSVGLFCWTKSRGELLPDSQSESVNPRGGSRRFGLAVPRLSWLDAAVFALCAAHVVSALFAIIGVAQKRFAMTMLWEWAAIAVQFFGIRQITGPTLRQAMLSILIGLSCYGIYQHWIEHPARVEQYLQTRSQLDALPPANRTIEQEQQYRQLISELISANAPLDGPRRELFERRLRDSVEPYGCFALANTFGGLMALLVILLLAEFVRGPSLSPIDRIKARWPIVIATLVGVYCLLLTKSRSAFLAAVGGVVVLVLEGLRTRSLRPSGSSNPATQDAFRKIVVVGLLSVVLLMAVVGGMFATGSIDVEVFSEAPKSLLYRIQYWYGTSDVIAENPWLGVGPGNFRGHYLKHKLPEASEEIADPHQFLLDVWANAGLAAFVAMLWIVGLFAKSLVNRDISASADVRVSGSASSRVVGLSIGLVLLWQWSIEAHWNLSVFVVGVGALIISFLLGRTTDFADAVSCGRPRIEVPDRIDAQSSDRTAGLAGAAALLTHLLVAGGIAYPGFNLTLLVMLSFATSGRSTDTIEYNLESASSEDDTVRMQRIITKWRTAAVAFLILGISALVTGLGPMLGAKTWLEIGDSHLSAQGDIVRARAAYLAAAEADPLSPTPHLSLAQLSYRSSNQGRVDKYFEEAVRHALDAMARAPHSRIAQHLLGKWYMERFRTTSIDEDIKQAVRWYQAALEGYPTNPIWNAEYALALQAAGETRLAVKQAKKSLRLESINQEAGHADRFLPDDLLLQLKVIVN